MQMSSGFKAIMNKQETISINIVLDGEEHPISTYRNEYRSLMALIHDKLYPDGFGECGGMGRCATCQVRLDNVQAIRGLDRNEYSTLSKQGISDPSIRLSCQLLIDASLHGLTVTVLA